MSKFSCPNIHQPKSFRSQTLIEIVLSIAMAAMVISALLVLGAASSKTVSSSLKRSQSTKLAVAGLEAMRYKRDTEGFISLLDGDYTIDSSTQTLRTVSGTECGNAVAGRYYCSVNVSEKNAAGVANATTNQFERSIHVSSTPSADFGDYLKEIIVQVRWRTGGREDNYQDVTVTSILSGWNK